jgi:hypothetical protein
MTNTLAGSAARRALIRAVSRQPRPAALINYRYELRVLVMVEQKILRKAFAGPAAEVS